VGSWFILKENTDKTFVDSTTEYIQIENTTVELVCKYTGKTSFTELLKNAMKRDAEAMLAGINYHENP